jgi:hypothetical protein
MNKLKIAAAAYLVFLLGSPSAFALKAVDNSSEDLFWTEPMTAHDFKKNTDLHSISVSTMALTELEFVKLGDGLLNFSLRSNKNPISRSLDSLEYSYSKLPRVEPVARFGQLFDALQLRQVSLSDARLIGMVILGDSMGGVTPMMQVRAYKLWVWLEDILYDVDKAVMFPVNWSVSSLRDKPTDIKSLGYAADGLGAFRWEFFSGLKWVSREVVRFSSNVVHRIEEPYDMWIRHKKKKKNATLLIYSKMPASVFKDNVSHFRGKNKNVFAGTIPEWKTRLSHDPDLLPDNVRQADFPFLEKTQDPDQPQEVIVAAQYSTWEKVPRELKKYVITPAETMEIIRP